MAFFIPWLWKKFFPPKLEDGEVVVDEEGIYPLTDMHPRLRAALDRFLNNPGPMRAGSVRVSIEALSELRQAYNEVRMLPRVRVTKDAFAVGQTWSPTTGETLRARTILEMNKARVGYSCTLVSGAVKKVSVTQFTWLQWVRDYGAICEVPAVPSKL
jgi:hypothetical protein